MATTNAQAGPSTFRPRNPSPKNETPSPINPVDEAEERAGAASGAGVGAGAGISRNGLSVDENGEVTKVPAFLTKLFSMVSDPGTNELIYWSPNGDSFFIPNQEQLAKKLLPRFFKHSNFQSFVRQLNMYAFHKVPHNSATPTGESELWEFINPLFKRDQPELLGRITRRQRVGVPPISTGVTGSSGTSRTATRQNNSTTQVASPGGSFHPIHLITDGTTLGDDTLPSQSIGGGGNNMVIGPQGMLDLSAITSGIAAIQRTQASIGADLKALQASNEHLWREAIEQREKHKKHQETIDLIVSFLERLFGTDGEGLKGLKEAMRRTGLARPASGAGGEGDGEDGGSGSGRKKRRLGVERMIEDGKGGEGKVVEISDKKSRYTDPFLSRPTRTRSDPSWTDPESDISARFQTIPSEGESSPSTVRHDTPNKPPSTGSGSGLHSGVGSSLKGDVRGGEGYDPLSMALAPYYPNTTSNINQNQNEPSGNYFDTTNSNINLGYGFSSNNNNPINTYLPPNQSTTGNNGISPYNLDPSLLQTTIGSLLQSPAAAQMFLNSLKQSAQAQSLVYPNSNPGQATNFNSSTGNGNGNGQNWNLGTSAYSDPTLALFNPLPNSPGPGMALDQGTLEENQAALLRSYENALGVNQGVEELQRGVDELVRSMGLDVGGAVPSASGVGAGTGETLDDIFRTDPAEARGGGVAEGGVKMENGAGLELDDGFDVDQFLKSLQDDETGGQGLDG